MILLGLIGSSVGYKAKKVINYVRPDTIAVAMEEASKLGMGCFLIDQDDDVTSQQLYNLVSSDSTWIPFESERFVEAYEKLKKEGFTRSVIQEFQNIQKDVSPESVLVVCLSFVVHGGIDHTRFEILFSISVLPVLISVLDVVTDLVIPRVSYEYCSLMMYWSCVPKGLSMNLLLKLDKDSNSCPCWEQKWSSSAIHYY
ncbi:hypothetical protein MKW98_010941 [Papaver atlanticum]|uniref:Uncharacterized protein n=1 Tax=Papaver atlanticum TaxID=357466 RepID=A0AAD4SN79_9MAGN|nr:hypothetical protein MKW98_010941 [Papaver atlanticum]